MSPSLAARPAGCAFHPRCPNALDICRRDDPAATVEPSGRAFRCHNPAQALPA
jgi:oligopeptide/dipeptide ABC transporter ATP-binding protein